MIFTIHFEYEEYDDFGFWNKITDMIVSKGNSIEEARTNVIDEILYGTNKRKRRNIKILYIEEI